MTEKTKRLFASLAALAALALGGAAIAGATSGGSSSSSGTATEQEQGEAADPADQGVEDSDQSNAGDQNETGEQSDPSEVVTGADAAKARASAEQATGGQADEVTTETPDGVDANEQPAPASTAYEVELTKGGKEMKALLDSSFQVLDVRADAGS